MFAVRAVDAPYDEFAEAYRTIRRTGRWAFPPPGELLPPRESWANTDVRQHVAEELVNYWSILMSRRAIHRGIEDGIDSVRGHLASAGLHVPPRDTVRRLIRNRLMPAEFEF
jgi:hypothetical protein